MSMTEKRAVKYVLILLFRIHINSCLTVIIVNPPEDTGMMRPARCLLYKPIMQMSPKILLGHTLKIRRTQVGAKTKQ